MLEKNQETKKKNFKNMYSLNFISSSETLIVRVTKECGLYGYIQVLNLCHGHILNKLLPKSKYSSMFGRNLLLSNET